VDNHAGMADSHVHQMSALGQSVGGVDATDAQEMSPAAAKFFQANAGQSPWETEVPVSLQAGLDPGGAPTSGAPAPCLSLELSPPDPRVAECLSFAPVLEQDSDWQAHADLARDVAPPPEGREVPHWSTLSASTHVNETAHVGQTAPESSVTAPIDLPDAPAFDASALLNCTEEKKRAIQKLLEQIDAQTLEVVQAIDEKDIAR